MSKQWVWPVVGVLCAAASAPAQTVTLPEGNGKDIVETVCAQCHPLSLVTKVGYSRPDWEILVKAMVFRGAKLTPDQVPVVIDYMAANFPKQAAPAGGK
jgi:virginiamycin B lyase